jgi:hypothetical protein
MTRVERSRRTTLRVTTRKAAASVSFALALALACCGGPAHDSGDLPEVTELAGAAEQAGGALAGLFDKAVAAAREIRTDSSSVEEILKQHGLTVEKFEDVLYQISDDRELSEKFNRAVGG